VSDHLEKKAVGTTINLPKGCIGVWDAHTIGTKSYLYESPKNTTAQNQKVVDRENCALWWPYGKGHAVCDHAESELPGGLWRVQDISVDDNATLTLPNGTRKYYTCMGVLTTGLRMEQRSVRSERKGRRGVHLVRQRQRHGSICRLLQTQFHN